MKRKSLWGLSDKELEDESLHQAFETAKKVSRKGWFEELSWSDRLVLWLFADIVHPTRVALISRAKDIKILLGTGLVANLVASLTYDLLKIVFAHSTKYLAELWKLLWL